MPAASLITIPLVDFALPVPRTGSIEAHSGYGRAAAEGQMIHQRVQRRRAKADPRYQPEVAVSCSFEREGFHFRVDGRMDGLFRHDLPRIEEIKSGFDIPALARRLAEDPLAHPYGLQLLTYGYCYLREHGVLPALSFHLVPSRGGEARDLDLPFDLPGYEKWLERRLDELVAEAKQAQKRAARRRRVAARFVFPFAAPRPGQAELMAEVEGGLAAGRPLLVQAPTGLGKTVGVLHPVLQEALARGQRVIYVTPKNSQHAVAEEALDRFRAAGVRLRSLAITAKAKLCFMEEPLCSPEYCEYARDYYAKLAANDLDGVLAKRRSLKARAFRELGEKYRVCPFELQLEAVRQADVVICDYNYVFAPRSALGRVRELGIDQDGKPSLVVDEAHNLPARAMDYYSPALSCAALERLRAPLEELPLRFRGEALELLADCRKIVAACREGERSGPMRIDPPAERFLEQDGRLGTFLARYLEGTPRIGARDPVLGLGRSWSEFTEALRWAGDPERQEFFASWQPQGGGMVKITCCDASALLADCYGGYQQVVGFSATLKPFDYYLRLSGLAPEEVGTAEFASPFPRERRKLLIIPQVSTRYRHRADNYARIAEAVSRIAALRRGNYLVFLPSFEFLEEVAARFTPPEGFAVQRQERGMPAAAVEEVVAALRGKKAPTVAFAVQGGSFAEGIDYAGEAVIGAFVVGPPLPGYDLEREEMKAYYQRRYGAGFDYAYVIPAMARAVQAAGRVIRSETDRGLIVLMDSRFLEPAYTGAMPADWFEADARELVSSSILKDVAAFWEGEAEDLSHATPRRRDAGKKQ